MIKQVKGLLVVLLLTVTACFKETVGPAPGAFTLATPLQNQVCTTGKTVSSTQSKIGFSWAASANANNYDLTITNLLTQTSTTVTVQSPQDSVILLQNTPYSWYVTAKAPKTTTVIKSSVWKFYSAGSGIVTYAPFPATITSPGFGQTLLAGSTTVNLTWMGSSVSNNIVAYNVYFGPTINPPLFKNYITDSFVNNVAISVKTIYYWHVVTVDANGNLSDSGIYNFSVQ